MSFDEIQWLRIIVAAVGTAIFVAASVIFLVYLERKVAGQDVCTFAGHDVVSMDLSASPI